MKFYPWVSCLERLYRFTLAGGVRLPWVSYLERLYRTLLAGECPLFSAWGRFEDGAPASRVRYALEVAYPSDW